MKEFELNFDPECVVTLVEINHRNQATRRDERLELIFTMNLACQFPRISPYI